MPAPLRLALAAFAAAVLMADAGFARWAVHEGAAFHPMEAMLRIDPLRASPPAPKASAVSEQSARDAEEEDAPQLRYSAQVPADSPPAVEPNHPRAGEAEVTRALQERELTRVLQNRELATIRAREQK